MDNLDDMMIGPEIGSDQIGVQKISPHRREKALRDIGGFRVTNDTFSKSVVVPADAEFFCAFAEAGDSRLEMTGIVANSVSTLVVFEETPLMFYPVAPGQSITCYGAAATWCNFRFLGRKYPDE
jgi:hypothetical protein